jgi:hypothetical protein
MNLNMENEPEYIVEDAAEIVYENVSLDLKQRFSIDDIIKILEMEFEYQKQIGLVTDNRPFFDFPTPVDTDQMHYFIIHHLAKQNIILTSNDLREVLEAETIYLEKLGLIDEEGWQASNN